jgi:hypothetical protein
MRFGVREICDVVFKAKSNVTIGSKTFVKGQPVLYIDSAKTSTIEGAGTSVYATGGRGNTRLITWEGEKTLTFTVEDALLSPVGFAVLSGAGLFKDAEGDERREVHVHRTTVTTVGKNGVIDLTDVLGEKEEICGGAPIFVVYADEDGSLSGDGHEIVAILQTGNKTLVAKVGEEGNNVPETTTVFCDYYVKKNGSQVTELQIDAANFAGYYYVEASTLFRRQNDGKDLPAEITFPNVKIQSNFTFTMASTGDPSTFTFTMDAMPGYTYFDKRKKVLCVMQVIEEDNTEANPDEAWVMDHDGKEATEATLYDTSAASGINVANGYATWTAVDKAAYYKVAVTVDDETATYKVEHNVCEVGAVDAEDIAVTAYIPKA